MVKKTIYFDVMLKSSDRINLNDFKARQKVMTNDKNSVDIVFRATDVEPDDLKGATASIFLYMQDGSFFQSNSVVITSNILTYTMTQNQTQHKGTTKVQIVVKSGTIDNASLLQEFEISPGLEKYPLTEVMIQDWTTLTAEAKAFVDQIEGFTLESFVENKMGQELANLEVNYATRLTGLESNDASLTAQLAQTVENVSGMWVDISGFPRLAGEVDDTGRLRRAVSEIPLGQKLFLPKMTVPYIISDTVTVTRAIDFECRGDIVYSGPKDRTALVFRALEGRSILIRGIYDAASYPAYSTGYHGWENDDYVGLQLENLKQCRIDIFMVANFSTGIKVRCANGGGHWFNHHYFENIRNCRVCLELNSDGKSAAGEPSWMNANYFYNLSPAYNGGTQFQTASKDRYSVLQTLTNGNEYGGNSNYFFNFKFETHGGFGGSVTQVKLLKASFFEFVDYRTEFDGIGSNEKQVVMDLSYVNPNIATTSAHSSGNEFNSVHDIKIEYENTGKVNGSYLGIAKKTRKQLETIFDSGDLKERVRMLNDNNYALSGFVSKPLNSRVLTEENSAFYSTTDIRKVSGVEFSSSNPLVFYLTNLKKGDTFRLELKSLGELLPSAVFKFFDTSGMLIESGKVGENKVLAHNGSWNSTLSTWGPHSQASLREFTVNADELSTIAVLIYGGVQSFAVRSTNIRNTVVKTTNPLIYNQPKCYHAASPIYLANSGFFPGDVVLNSNKAAGKPHGWLLTNNSGTFTWVSFGQY